MSQLTDNQVDLIVETWKIPAANPIDSAELILYKFFEKYPHNQQKFYKFKNVPLEQLKGTPAFRAHASRVLNTFSATVDSIQLEGGWEEVKNIWNEIGQSHSKRRISREAFLELRDVIVGILVEVCQMNDDHKQAWTILLDYIYASVFEVLGN